MAAHIQAQSILENVTDGENTITVLTVLAIEAVGKKDRKRVKAS